MRFNTLVTGKFSCLEFAGESSATTWYGNIMIADGTTIAKAPGAIVAADVASADYNFYAPTATFAGQSLADWPKLGFDQHSLNGDPSFVDPTTANYQLKPDSPCAHKAAVDAGDVPPTDLAGNKRSTPASIGAFELVGN